MYIFTLSPEKFTSIDDALEAISDIGVSIGNGCKIGYVVKEKQGRLVPILKVVIMPENTIISRIRG